MWSIEPAIHGGVIEGAQEIAARLKLAQETLVINSAPVKQHADGELIALRNPPDQHFV
jgi:hypothetical protein